MAVVTIGGESYHIDDKLIVKWDKIKDGKLAKADEDRVYVVDGRERSGKSVFTLQQAAYIDPTIIDDPSRITFSPTETLEAIRKTESSEKETKVIIFDEAFRGMSSRSVLSKVNKLITQALMEMGQKNLVLFIVSPSFFMLDMYSAVLRSNALFHIAKKKGSNQRSFKVYSHRKKALLYQLGMKKGWSYKVYTAFKGRFSGKYPGGDKFEEMYRKKKLHSLVNMEIDTVADAKADKYMIQRDKLITFLIDKHDYSQNKLAQELNQYGYMVSQRTISEVIKRSDPKAQIVAEITEKPRT